MATNTLASASRYRLGIQVDHFWSMVEDAGKQDQEVLALTSRIEHKAIEGEEALHLGDTEGAKAAFQEIRKLSGALIEVELRDVKRAFTWGNLLEVMAKMIGGWKR